MTSKNRHRGCGRDMLGQTVPSMGSSNREGPIADGGQPSTTDIQRQWGSRSNAFPDLEIGRVLELIAACLRPQTSYTVPLLPDLLSQSGRGRSLAVALFPSLDLLCGTVYRLNFGSSTVVLHFVDSWSHISFNFYRAMLRRVRLWDCMSSVRLSVCPSVTFRYRDHWSHRLEFFENNFTAK